MKLDGHAAQTVLEAAVAARAFPGAAAEAGTSAGPSWSFATGQLTYEPESARASSSIIYDLASLTKVIATTSIAMRLVERGLLPLDARVNRWMPEWTSGPFTDVRVRDLLEHSSGLAAWLPLFQTNKGRDEYRRAIAALEPEYQPRTKSVYSDLGFIVLGHVIESVAEKGLDDLFAEFRAEADLPDTLDFRSAGVAQGATAAPGFSPAITDIAPTEFDPWRGRLAAGEVHDENAFALGGVAPHAGLFGRAADVGAFARVVLRTFDERTALGSPAAMKEFAAKSKVPGSSRALGWDTMLPASSCGTRMSAGAIGHTGFTGTSLWIDSARDLYFVLLTNRVHPTRENNAIRAVRREFHDALLPASSARKS